MTAWWEGLNALQRVFATVAIPATLILVIQTVLLLIGLGGEHDADAGHGHDFGGHDHDFDNGGLEAHYESDTGGVDHGYDPGLRIFTLRAFIAFFSIFGWMGLALSKGGLNNALTVAVSICAGVVSMFVMAYFFRLVWKLQSQGNIDIRNAIGKSGTVYIPIPGGRTGRGKVTLVVQGRFSEVEALTDSDTPLKTGTEVTVVAVTNQNVLCVAPK